MRVTTMLGNSSIIGQSGMNFPDPLASGGIFANGGADINVWASRFQSEVRILTDETIFHLKLTAMEMHFCMAIPQ